MSQLKELDLNFHFSQSFSPEAYDALFETDEVLMLQEKVGIVRDAVGMVLDQTGVRIVDDNVGSFNSPGALSVPFKTRLPRSIYKLADEPFRDGISHTDGRAYGRLHIPMKKHVDHFEIRTQQRPSSNDIFKTRIPNHPDVAVLTSSEVASDRFRFTVLSIAAAAKFARTWKV